MAPIPMILGVFAFVCFFLSAFPFVAPYRDRLVSIGLACWVLVMVLGYSGVMGR